MDADANPLAELDDIRRDIDRIDIALLDLLQQRFALSERVRDAKRARGEDGGSPVRPGREAQLMRRLLAGRRDPLPLDLTVAVWRSIITSSTRLQADTTLNMSRDIAGNGDLRDLLRGHFGCIPVLRHDDDDSVLEATAQDRAAIAVFVPNGGWIRTLAEQFAGSTLSVTGSLPFLAQNAHPELLIVSHAPAEPTGEDETLVWSAGQLPREFVPSPLWRAELGGGHWLTSLPGFLPDNQMPLVSLTHRNDDLALRVLGRYPSPLAIQ